MHGGCCQPESLAPNRTLSDQTAFRLDGLQSLQAMRKRHLLPHIASTEMMTIHLTLANTSTDLWSAEQASVL